MLLLSTIKLKIHKLPNTTSSVSLLHTHDNIISGLVSMSSADGTRGQCPLSKPAGFIDCSSTQINDCNVFL